MNVSVLSSTSFANEGSGFWGVVNKAWKKPVEPKPPEPGKELVKEMKLKCIPGRKYKITSSADNDLVRNPLFNSKPVDVDPSESCKMKLDRKNSWPYSPIATGVTDHVHECESYENVYVKFMMMQSLNPYCTISYTRTSAPKSDDQKRGGGGSGVTGAR